MIKFVADAASDRILGCHIAGPGAGELIHEAVVAMVAGATYGDIGRAIHVHPTLAAGMSAAAGASIGRRRSDESLFGNRGHIIRT